jgi:hypothetical protein
MGEVYRARNSSSSVTWLSPNSERARLERKAKILASLNPAIAHIYGLEDGALVMELVEGTDPAASG